MEKKRIIKTASGSGIFKDDFCKMQEAKALNSISGHLGRCVRNVLPSVSLCEVCALCFSFDIEQSELPIVLRCLSDNCDE